MGARRTPDEVLRSVLWTVSDFLCTHDGPAGSRWDWFLHLEPDANSQCLEHALCEVQGDASADQEATNDNRRYSSSLM